MKIKLDIDATPQELRTFFGLPDVSRIQDEMMEQIRDQMLEGAKGFDAYNLIKPTLPPHLQSMEAFQKFWPGFGGMGAADDDKK